MFETMASNVNRLIPVELAIPLFDAIKLGDWEKGLN